MSKKKKSNQHEDRGGLVYSTNPKVREEIEKSLAPNEQRLRVRLEKNGRGGKIVTLIYGFDGNEKDLQNLGKTLKSACGTGGSVKNQEILVQGDHVQKVISKLMDMGYVQTKKSGG